MTKKYTKLQKWKDQLAVMKYIIRKVEFDESKKVRETYLLKKGKSPLVESVAEKPVATEKEIKSFDRYYTHLKEIKEEEPPLDLSVLPVYHTDDIIVPGVEAFADRLDVDEGVEDNKSEWKKTLTEYLFSKD